jgi:hypothetical protein
MPISPVDNATTAAGSLPSGGQSPIEAQRSKPLPKPSEGGNTPVGNIDGGIKSQLLTGNPGGVGAGFGLGISLDTGS